MDLFRLLLQMRLRLKSKTRQTRRSLKEDEQIVCVLVVGGALRDRDGETGRTTVCQGPESSWEVLGTAPGAGHSLGMEGRVVKMYAGCRQWW